MQQDTNLTKKPNPNPSNTTKDKQSKKKKKKDEFEFCKVCKLNHDQGRRHNYFPSHTKSLSAYLSRFQTKLSDVRFFLKNPSLLRPEHASRNRLWCVFCDFDIDELTSSFACGNAINHLASEDHLKNLKRFLWKYGGGMDRLDALRISDVDLAKWEKKCKSLKIGAATEGSHGPNIGPSNDIRNELSSEYIDTFDKNNILSLKSSFSNGVLPLQNYTNERYQVSHSELSEVGEVGPLLHDDIIHVHVDAQLGTNPWGLKDVTGYMDGQHSLLYDGRTSSADGFSNGGVCQDGRTINGGSICQGLHAITQISSTVREDGKGNVHSGAPPPWFNATEANPLNVGLKPGLGLSTVASPLSKPGKSQKLNPKRVGAAWAEKRKIELEMERRGECITNNFDANWLPNFGRVWQSGSRKESRKEFEVEDKKPLKVETETETSIKLQPYISKRMRRDDGK
ncbi:TITAN-like protein isoform X2 [Cornus florida]|uniref:TITAN-like protein isoform X2 n=1 Tax=Cornus florida TaxID=4283 RepID=UPI0028A08B0E|nr:TITAN-like protein isoform X2 [Cornus florida]